MILIQCIHIYPFTDDMLLWTPQTYVHMEFMRWMLVGIIGVITGIVAFLISIADKYINQLKLSVFEKCRPMYSASSYILPSLGFGICLIIVNFFFRSCFRIWYNPWLSCTATFQHSGSDTCVTFHRSWGKICHGSTLGLYIFQVLSSAQPVAAGSGIREVRCYLNGIKVLRVTRAVTLFSKTVGVLFSVAAGKCKQSLTPYQSCMTLMAGCLVFLSCLFKVCLSAKRDLWFTVVQSLVLASLSSEVCSLNSNYPITFSEQIGEECLHACV